jgi:hypothetical protein
LNDDQITRLGQAIETVEEICAADLLALVCNDDVGVFCVFRPGIEVTVARYLEEVNWRIVRLLAEEYQL